MVVDDRLEVLHDRPLARREPAPDVVGPDHRRAPRDESLRHVLVAAHVLAIAVYSTIRRAAPVAGHRCTCTRPIVIVASATIAQMLRRRGSRRGPRRPGRRHPRDRAPGIGAGDAVVADLQLENAVSDHGLHGRPRSRRRAPAWAGRPERPPWPSVEFYTGLRVFPPVFPCCQHRVPTFPPARTARVHRQQKTPRLRGFRMRPGRFELPRSKRTTRPSTLRVYQFRHRRLGR
jgi:hypothetical protein